MTAEPISNPSTGGEMRSAGTTSNDGEGLTILLVATRDELYFSGSVNLADLDNASNVESNRKEEIRRFLELVWKHLQQPGKQPLGFSIRLAHPDSVPEALESRLTHLVYGEHTHKDHKRNLEKLEKLPEHFRLT